MFANIACTSFSLMEERGVPYKELENECEVAIILHTFPLEFFSSSLVSGLRKSCEQAKLD
jgi:hypothetical protein